MATVITAPHPFSNVNIYPKIFLAGSIEMDRADHWQNKLVDSLQDYTALLLNPRRECWDSSWTQSIDHPQFREQVEWELNGLEQSDIIIVYFDPKTQSPITLLEVGLYAKSGKILLCCPDGFWRKGNIEIVCNRYNIPLFHTFSDLIEALKLRIQQSTN